MLYACWRIVGLDERMTFFTRAHVPPHSVAGSFGRRIASLVAGVVLILGAFALPALAQSVRVQGNSRVETETIRTVVALGPGESYTPARIDRAIKDLFATGLFSDVKITREGNGISVRVAEYALVNRVTFSGNSKVKADSLFGEVQTRSRGAFSQAIVDQDIERIRNIYRRLGRAAVDVKANLTPAADGRTDVAFVINEGSKTGIKSITFVGNENVSNWRLKGLMQLTESNLLSFFKTSDVYDPERLAGDLDNIRRYYQRHGYADFRINRSDVQYDNAEGGYRIVITMNEGPRYTIGLAEVESRIADVDPARLKSAMRTRSGQVYDASEIEKSVDAMMQEVAQRGYAFAQVRPRADRDAANGRINLVYAVEEGARVYVERIVVRGNTRTRDYVIRREFDIGEGDAYNKAAIDRAERRLKNLNFFKNVRITNEPGSAPDRVVVNVDVEDQATGSFSVAGGYSTTDGVLAEVSVQETNFLGKGQYARVAINTGQRTRGGELNFTEPFFMGYRLAAGFDVFSKFSDVNSYTRYRSRNTGFTLRSGLPITEDFTIGARYSLYQQNITIPNTGKYPYDNCQLAGAVASCLTDGEASMAIKEARGKNITSLAGLTFLYNTLDNNNDPTKGLYADLKPDFAGLGGDSRFIRATASMRYYYPITDDVIGMVKLQGGHIAAYGSDKLRVLDHFYMGPDLVRGYASSGLGPRDTVTESSANAVGGTTYFGGTAEVTFPIFGLPREIGLRGAVFADAGTLFGYRGKKWIDLNKDGVQDCGAGIIQSECMTIRDDKSLRSSVGVGLLWSSPLGPIRIDYAYALARNKGAGHDELQALRFSGGAKF